MVNLGKKKNIILSIIALFLGVSLFGLVLADRIADDINLTIQTTDSGGNIITGSYDFVFKISNSSTCSNFASVEYTNTTTLTTDDRGIISLYLHNVTINFAKQYYLCYYRNSTLKDTVRISKTPYSFRGIDVNTSSITADKNLNLLTYNITGSGKFYGTINASNITRENWIEASSESGLDVNSSTWWAGLTAWTSGWFTETANSLGFNETRLNNTINAFLGNGTFTGNIDWATAYNGTLARTTATNTFGAFNQTFDTNLLQIASNTNRVGIGTTTPKQTLNVVGTGNFTTGLTVQGITLNDTIDAIVGNGTYALNASLADYTRWSEATNGTLAINSTIAAYVVAKNNSFGTYVRAKNDSLGTYVRAKNDSLATWVGVNFRTLENHSILGSNNFSVFTNNLFVSNNNNRVGIGTTTPKNALDVVGTGNFTTGLTVQGITLNNTINAFLGNGTFTGKIDWATAYNGTLARTTAANTFGAFNQTFDTNLLHIASNTNRVGIGTTTPKHTLNVKGTLNVTQNSTFDEGTLYVEENTNRVGINNTNPQHVLDVSGNLSVDNTLFVDTQNNRVQLCGKISCTGSGGTKSLLYVEGGRISPNTIDFILNVS